MTITTTIKPDAKGLDMTNYSLRDAAKELGIHPQTLKRHKYDTGLFADYGELIGRSLVFTDDEIATMRKLLANAPGHGRTTLTRRQVHDRQMKALQMHIGGKSLAEIAKRLKFKDTSGAFRAIQAAKKKRGD